MFLNVIKLFLLGCKTVILLLRMSDTLQNGTSDKIEAKSGNVSNFPYSIYDQRVWSGVIFYVCCIQF